MPEATASLWVPRSAWAGYARPGRHGRAQGEPGIRLTPRDGIALATIVAADGREEALRAILSERYGWELAPPGRAHLSGEGGLIWSAPGQWLAMAGTRDALRELPDLLRPVAAVTDQSDGRAVVRVSGPRARTLMEKGVAVDLHPRVFGKGSAAVTAIAHIGVQFWQRDDEPVYDVAVARSFACSFWSWLTEAAAEFGYAVEAAPCP